MTQTEFIDKLSACLSGKVSSGTVRENVAYYNQYFAEELTKGRSEEAICEALGTPQLIAKGILEAEKFQSNYSSDYSEEVHEEKNYGSTGSRKAHKTHSFRLPGWLFALISAVVFFAVINIVISVFSALAPLLLPICIVLFVMHIFRNNF